MGSALKERGMSGVPEDPFKMTRVHGGSVGLFQRTGESVDAFRKRAIDRLIAKKENWTKVTEAYWGDQYDARGNPRIPPSNATIGIKGATILNQQGETHYPDPIARLGYERTVGAGLLAKNRRRYRDIL